MTAWLKRMVTKVPLALLLLIFAPILIFFGVVLLPFAMVDAICYRRFLKHHEGQGYFVYTNRKTSCMLVETMLVPIAKTMRLELIKREGCHMMHNSLPASKYLCRALIFEAECPFIAVIRNGRVESISMHQEIYAAVQSRNRKNELSEKFAETVLQLIERKQV